MACAVSLGRSILAAIAMLTSIVPAHAQAPCRVLCSPTLLFEPTFTIEDPAGTRERVFEAIVALDVPTRHPRVGIALEAITAPFVRNDAGGFDNPVELEAELNLTWLESSHTRGWVSSHFDIVDKFSPAEQPSDKSAYTHKLNFELDTAVALFRYAKRAWLREMEAEASLDYVASGLPTGAPRWGLSLVLVIPLTR
jgi:hypothetical protein